MILNKSQQNKREIDLVVISDTHLGTYGCQATELYRYLKSINPKKIILNGDIIDIWQFSKNYWPESHMKVLKKIISWITEGKEVVYVTGNHDEMLRKFAGLRFNNFSIVNKTIFNFNQGQKAWIFHGDVFDVTMKHSKWLAKLGGKGYDLLIIINSLVNWISVKLGKGKLSLSKKIKNSVKSAVKFINDFEEIAIKLGAEKNYSHVICGHIHQPIIKTARVKNKKIIYMNSGDWVENLSALEFVNGTWSLHFHDSTKNLSNIDEVDELKDLESALLYENLLKEFKLNVV